uniref:Integral membrane protein 2 n=1 Tax=Ornithodoros turicata TaxID=34597 RepID=A0A2R5LDM6_9ACAR
MTIITQPLTEKKLAKSPQAKPLVQHEAGAERDVEGSPVIVTMRARRVSTTTTLCVFITALLVLSTGIVGGVYLYRQFTHYKLRHFKGWCGVPYVSDYERPSRTHTPDFLRSNSAGSRPESSNMLVDSVRDNFFQERFDLDLEFEQYEQIEVPDFTHGRRGRFIHDFAVNKTGIVDMDGQRCFVMPLNRSLVLPPHSLFDLIVKMRAGYYDVDTEIVRERMRVVTPPILDFRGVGYYIARECASLPTYRLERMTSPVFKRSLDSKDPAVFVEFAGAKITEIDIMNIDDAVGATAHA